jgi:uncharacterized membrane protein YfcA
MFELVIIIFALAIGGFTKGLTGLGLPMISIPIMANFIGAERAIMIMIMPTIILNIWLAITNRAEYKSIPELPWLLMLGVPGAFLGATFLYLAPGYILDTVLAIWVLIYLLIRFINKNFKLSSKARRFLPYPVGFVAGALQASTGISAPVIAAYIDALQLNKSGYVFAVASAFATLSFVHFLSLLFYSAISMQQIYISMIAVLPAIIFVQPGVYLRNILSQSLFDSVIKLILLIMAVQLIYKTWI